MSKPDDQPQADPLLGTIFARRYLIERRLGRGGMGVVYQALQTDLNRPVVLKVLAPDWIGDAEAMARFEREARGLSSLQHPNIVTIHDFGKLDGRAFIVMEYIAGEALDRFVRRKVRLTLADFVPIAAQVLKGLGEAHSRGIIHRDIKPANIMLCERQGRANYVKILDFGLAKLVSGSSDITKQNVLGTPTCLSPEQILGEKIDQRVDVYAVGILFYFMLTGVMPFQADNDASVLYQHVHVKPQNIAELLPPDHGVPEGVLELIHRCLEKSRDRRPRDANEVVEGLIDQVPFSMFRLPRAQPRTEPLPEPEEPQPSSEHSNAVPAPENIVVGTFGRVPSAPVAAAPHIASVPTPPPQTKPVTSPFPAQTLEQLKAQGIPVDGGSVLQVQDGRTVLVVGQQQAQDAASRQRLLNFAYAGGAGLAVLGVLWYALSGPGRGPEDAQASAGAAGETAGQNDVVAQLDRIEALIEEGKPGLALRKLESSQELFDRVPDHADRADALRVQAEAAQLVATARKFERDGDKVTALKTYREVLGIDAENADAKQAIKSLFPELNPDVGFAIITIRSGAIAAEASIDGRALGTTPVDVPLHAGKYTVSLNAAGYSPLQTGLSVSSAKDQTYDYQLAAGKPAGGATTPTPPTGGGTPATPTGGGTTTPKWPKKPAGGGTTRPPDTQPKPKPKPKPDDGDDDLMDIPSKKNK